MSFQHSIVNNINVTGPGTRVQGLECKICQSALDELGATNMKPGSRHACRGAIERGAWGEAKRFLMMDLIWSGSAQGGGYWATAHDHWGKCEREGKHVE